eukprot:gnl/MRDRNA2_/MRDRNA2_92822_c0_seq1.p1 gnl/MRDRNA2_/MRDRNA2_92822_c0~~gnl/MRDRNA2_/MRDRNA2_92822_c0_seq1.p1  ORF type:complete len:480 (-),score=109.99 gnl/MRDRNA2_/MRDRNA2_92822_c0_seq1:161-1600(-)
MISFEHQYINGAWVPSTNAGKTLDVIDSNTGKVCGKVPDGSVEDANKAAAAAKAALDSWSATPLAERKAYVQKILEKFQAKKADVAKWLTKELGCPQTFAESVQANLFDAHVSTLLGVIDSIEWQETCGKSIMVKEPIGVVGCITPWNYPLNQIALKIAPALLTGCTVILKPSEVTPINAYLLCEAIHEAGLPKGVFNMVCGTGVNCGEALSRHPDVDMISFTGSTRAGKAITVAAAETLKRVRTELGGKSAALLLDDCDFPKVVPAFMQQLMGNTGQSCNALSRMLVPRAKYEEVVGIAKGVAEKVNVGRADDPKAHIGPLVSQVQWDRVQSYLKKGVDEGARLVTGGPGKPAGLEDGYFVKPTVFADVHNKMAIAQEEIFGPVLSMIPYDTEDEAIKIANDTIYGLNNAVGSQNQERAMKVASKLKSGMVMINATNMDMQGAFGGYKQSGNAREWGKHGVEEFLITKTLNGKIPAKL